MKITESRANDILHWLDDETGNHALLFEKMTLHRDAAALIRQLQAEAKAAEIETLKVEVAAQRTRADAMAGEAIKHEARAERLAEALHAAVGSTEAGITPLPQPPAEQPRA